MVEHYVRDVGVGGSNPLTPTNKKALFSVGYKVFFRIKNNDSKKLTKTRVSHVFLLVFFQYLRLSLPALKGNIVSHCGLSARVCLTTHMTKIAFLLVRFICTLPSDLM